MEPPYIAGLFDGDGMCTITVTFFPTEGKGLRKRRRINFLLDLAITQFSTIPEIGLRNSDKKVLEAIKNHFNSGVISSRPSGFNPQRKVHRWGIHSRKDIMNFINSIMPHTIIKKRQLELMKEFIELKNDKREWTTSQIKRAIVIALKITKLNIKSKDKTIQKLEGYLSLFP